MNKLILSFIILCCMLVGGINLAWAWSFASPNSTTPTKIYFKNIDISQSYSIYWVNFENQNILYKTLLPGASYIQDTYMGHNWVVGGIGIWEGAIATHTSTNAWDVVSFGISTSPIENTIPEIRTMPLLSSWMGTYTVIPKLTLFSKYELCSNWVKLKGRNGRRLIKVQTNTMGILYASAVTKESQNEIWLTNVYSPKEKKYYNSDQHVVVQCR